jgi:hypothetical protein
MKRSDAIRTGVLVALVAVVLGGLLLFHLRVRIAGMKYLVLVGGAVAFAWWISRRRE